METNRADEGPISSHLDASALIPLTGSEEFEIADGYPEVRGWDVRDAGNRSIGYVHDLLVDRDSMRVRYVDVELDAPDVSGEDTRMLIPIEAVSLDGGDEVVSLHGTDVADVPTLAPPARQPVAREEDSLAATERARRPTDTPVPLVAVPADLALSPSVDPPAELTPQDLPIGDVVVRTTVATDRVKERVPVVREELEIDRRPVQPGEQFGPIDMTADEIRIPIMAEEIVVEKRLVPREVLVIRKRRVAAQRIVEAELRREEIRVDERL